MSFQMGNLQTELISLLVKTMTLLEMRRRRRMLKRMKKEGLRRSSQKRKCQSSITVLFALSRTQ